MICGSCYSLFSTWILSVSVLSLCVQRLWKFILEDESSREMSFIHQFSPNLPVLQNCIKINACRSMHQTLEKNCNPRTGFCHFHSCSTVYKFPKLLHGSQWTACWAKYYEAWIKIKMTGPYLSYNFWESFSTKINICHWDYIAHKKAIRKKLHGMIARSEHWVTKLSQFPKPHSSCRCLKAK